MSDMSILQNLRVLLPQHVMEKYTYSTESGDTLFNSLRVVRDEQQLQATRRSYCCNWYACYTVKPRGPPLGLRAYEISRDFSQISDFRVGNLRFAHAPLEKGVARGTKVNQRIRILRKQVNAHAQHH